MWGYLWYRIITRVDYSNGKVLCKRGGYFKGMRISGQTARSRGLIQAILRK